MSFSGIDIDLLRGLARSLEADIAPTLRRNANVAYDVLSAYRGTASADLVGTRLTGVAGWLDSAAHDLRRRAGAVEAAESIHPWRMSLPRHVVKSIENRAVAAGQANFTTNFEEAYETWVHDQARAHGNRFVCAMTKAIANWDEVAIAAVAASLRPHFGEPWFDEAMARLFDALEPGGVAVMTHGLLEQPPADYDHQTLARAFAAATRGGLGWTPDDISLWFDHGAVGAAQYLRAGIIDRDFLRMLVDTVGFGYWDYTFPEAIPNTRLILGGGLSIWSRLGPENSDPRAIVLGALSRDVTLAIELLQVDGVVEDLIDGADGWHYDKGMALGNLLATVARQGRPVDAAAADEILRRVILTVGNGEVPVGKNLAPALATIAGLYMPDFAHSLATTQTRLEQDLIRPGFELPAAFVRSYLRPLVENDEAFTIIAAQYGRYLGGVLAGSIPEYAIERDLTNPDDYHAYLRSHADEIGALTFALVYLDKDADIATAEVLRRRRLTTLHVVEFLASTGALLVPGGGIAVAAAKTFTIGQIFDAIERRADDAASGLADHSDFKEQLLSDLEYLIAIRMHEYGLVDEQIDIDPINRLEFMNAVEAVDGDLESVMSIIEAQARTQREVIEES